VTLKVSKARAVLPSKKQAVAARVSTRRCEALGKRIGESLPYGPLLPDGKFVSTGNNCIIRPIKPDWRRGTNKGGNWKPIHLDLQILDSKTRRNLCVNPFKREKYKIPVGPEKLYPTRECVLDFHRRSHALELLKRACGSLSQCDPCFILVELNKIIALLPKIFRRRVTAIDSGGIFVGRLFILKRILSRYQTLG